MIGKTLDHYKIIEMIGKGGMGNVYRARDTKLDRNVALKILNLDSAQDLKNKQRFEREAKAIATLKHPHIVTIYSFEESNGIHFITMELVEGKLLLDLIPAGGLSLERFFDITLPLASAVSSAHSEGITHRDLKPANVMFDKMGQLKVLDFGLAKQSLSPSSDLEETLPAQENITIAGSVLGTISYMSPEQVTGAEVDLRSDIFSLGIIFYELLCGSRPFVSENTATILYKIVNEDAPAMSSIPDEIAGIIARCLRKAPNNRYANGQELLDALRLAMVNSGVTPKPEPEISPGSKKHSTENQDHYQKSSGVSKYTTTHAHDVFLSYARDNRPVAERMAEGLRNNGFNVWWDSDILPGAQFVDSIEAGLKNAACVVVLWSQKSVLSRYVRNEAEFGANHGKLVPVLIEDVSIPWEVSNIHTMDLKQWAQNGNDEDFAQLVHGLRSHIDGKTGSVQRSQIEYSPTSHTAPPKVQSKGRMIVLMAVLVAVALGSWFFTQQRLNTDEPASITQNWKFKHISLTGDGKTQSSDLSPDGSLLVYAHNNNGKFSLRVKQIAEGNESILVPEKIQGIRSPVFSPDGSIVYFAMVGPEFSMDSFAEYDLYRIPILGGRPQKIINRITGLRFNCSPNGKQLVFQKIRGDSTFVVISNSDGSNQYTISRCITDLKVRCNLAWSTDGQSIYTAIKDTVSNQLKIISIPSKGGPAKGFGRETWQAIMDLCPLPDVSGLLVAGLPSSNSDDLNLNLWFQSNEAKNPIQLTNDLTHYYQISLDDAGSKMALTHYSTKRLLRIMATADTKSFRDISSDVVVGGKVVWTSPGHLLVNQKVGRRDGLVKVTTDGDTKSPLISNEDYIYQVAYSQDGKHLAYTSFCRGETSIHLCDGEGNTPRLLSEKSGNGKFPYFSPDCQSLFYSLRKDSEQFYYLMQYSLATETTTKLSDIPGFDPKVSPDGTKIMAYFMDNEHGRYRPGIIAPSGGMPTYFDIPNTYEILAWNPMGDGFTCFNSDGATPNIWNFNLGNGDVTQLTFFPPGHNSISGLAWNAAGDSLAVALESTTNDSVLLEISSH